MWYVSTIDGTKWIAISEESQKINWVEMKPWETPIFFQQKKIAQKVVDIFGGEIRSAKELSFQADK